MVEIETLREQLREGLVKFDYKKMNGELREAVGTLKLDIIENYNGPMPKGIKPQNKDVLNYFDIDSEGWRACKVDNIIKVIGATPIKVEQTKILFK